MSYLDWQDTKYSATLILDVCINEFCPNDAPLSAFINTQTTYIPWKDVKRTYLAQSIVHTWMSSLQHRLWGLPCIGSLNRCGWIRFSECTWWSNCRNGVTKPTIRNDIRQLRNSEEYQNIELVIKNHLRREGHMTHHFVFTILCLLEVSSEENICQKLLLLLLLPCMNSVQLRKKTGDRTQSQGTHSYSCKA